MGDGKTLAHGYRTLQHWNQWLSHHFLGKQLLQTENKILTDALSRHFGKHALLLGVPYQADLLNSSTIPCHTMIGPLILHNEKACDIESDFHHLPILTGCADLVVLPHTLEFIDHPRQLLSEACRIVKPEGLIVIFGFNPYSAWGLRKWFAKHKVAPWSGSFIYPNKLKNWLKLADFELEMQRTDLFKLPISNEKVYQKLNFLEKVIHFFFPRMGGIYMMVARAKVIPLTPIKMKWTQQLSGIRISTTMPGHIARQSE